MALVAVLILTTLSSGPALGAGFQPPPPAALDLNGDLAVDLDDLAELERSLGQTSDSPGWKTNHDLVPDGAINLRDLTLVARSTGRPVGLTALASSASLPANGSSTAVLTLAAVDGTGTPVPAFKGLVTVSSSNSAAVALLVNGTATGSATVPMVYGAAQLLLVAGTETGTVQISASAPGLTGTAVGLETLSTALAAIRLRPDWPTMTAEGNSSIPLWIELIGASGLPLAQFPPDLGSIPLRLQTLGPVNLGNGTASADVMLTSVKSSVPIYGSYNIGQTSITGTVLSPSGTIPVTGATVESIITGSPYKLMLEPLPTVTAGNQANLAVLVTDYAGNRITTPTGNRAATVTASTTGTTQSLDLNTVHGRGVIAYVPLKAGFYTIEAVASGTSSLLPAKAALDVVPGPAASLSLRLDPWEYVADGVQEGTLTVRVTDIFGNFVTEGNHPITVTNSNPEIFTLSPASATTVDGVATFSVKASTTVGSASFTASGVGVTQSVAGHNRVVGPAAVLALLNGTPITIMAGTAARVWADVRDANGLSVTNDQGRALTLHLVQGDTVLSSVEASTVNGVATFSISPTNAGVYELVVTGEGLTTAPGRWLTVAPGTAGRLRLHADRTLLSAGGFSTARLKVTVQDAYGNPVAYTGQVTLTTSDSSVARFADGAYSTTLTLTATSTATTELKSANTVGSAVIQAVSTGLLGGVASINVAITGVAAWLLVDPIPAVRAGERQKVTIRLQDALGQTLSAATNPVILEAPPEAPTTALYVWSELDETWSPYTAGTQVPLYKGMLTFGASVSRAGTMTYSLTAATGYSDLTATGTGMVTAGKPLTISLAASPPSMPADGSSLSVVTATVTDSFGNIATSATGTVTFTLSTPEGQAEGLTLLAGAAPLIEGKAQITVRSNYLTAGGEGTVVASYRVDSLRPYVLVGMTTIELTAPSGSGP